MNNFAKLLIVLLLLQSCAILPSATNTPGPNTDVSQARTNRNISIINPTTTEETDLRTDVSQETITRIGRRISPMCSLIETCQPLCCKLYYLYSMAMKQCTTDIDDQLAAVQWISPFAKVYHQFWESVCSPNASRELASGTLLQASSYLVKDSISCKKFDHFCYQYSDYYLNFSTCYYSEYDVLWKTWLPSFSRSLIIFAIIEYTFTLLLFMLVPELCEKVHDKCFLLYIISRNIESVIFFIIIYFDPNPGFFCNFVAFVDQFFGLASSFWFNVICFHLWYKIRNQFDPFQSSSTALGVYFLYAFCPALLITVITHTANLWLPPDSPYVPRFGYPYCIITAYEYALGSSWFQPLFIYYYSVKIVTKIIDSCAFIDIAYTISTRDKRFTCNPESNQLCKHQAKQIRIFSYMKLFVLMGTTNLLVFIMYLLSHSGMMRLFLSLLSFLNGICVLAIILGRDEVKEKVKKRFFKSKKNRISQKHLNFISQETLTTEV